MQTISIEDVKNKIRAVPDFPKKGIIFRDITTGIKDADTMRAMIDYLCDQYKDERVDYIAPFVNIDKSEVLRRGVEAMKKLNFTDSDINSVLLNTHTCYDVNEKGESCGQCGSCRERLEAFEKNNMKDPIPYQK